MCLGCTALALGMVMAGTGELSTLRLFRELRMTIEDDVYFGNHMSIGMAIGYYFLGVGVLPLAVAMKRASLVSLFLFSNDNYRQLPLPSIPSLIRLAVEQRLIEALTQKL